MTRTHLSATTSTGLGAAHPVLRRGVVSARPCPLYFPANFARSWATEGPGDDALLVAEVVVAADAELVVLVDVDVDEVDVDERSSDCACGLPAIVLAQPLTK